MLDQLPAGERDLVQRAVGLIGQRLPDGWSVTASTGPGPLTVDRLSSWKRGDARLQIAGPDRQIATFALEVTNSVRPRDLPSLAIEAQEVGGAGLLVVSRYLPESTRERLSQVGLSYCDVTGSLLIRSDRPALFLRDVGAPKDPDRGPGRPRGTLKGDPAARVVRALADLPTPASVPELARLSQTSTGAAYRVVEFLEEQDLLTRSRRGPIQDVRRRPLLERWSQDYSFLESNQVSRFLQPRGLPAVLKGLAQFRGRYAVTGSLAAQKWESYAPPRAAMIYTDDIEECAEALGLRQVETGANVLLAKPAYPVVYERTQTLDDVTIVAPSQAAVDLLTGPGRNPAEAEALLDWMERNVDTWR